MKSIIEGVTQKDYVLTLSKKQLLELERLLFDKGYLHRGIYLENLYDEVRDLLGEEAPTNF